MLIGKGQGGMEPLGLGLRSRPRTASGQPFAGVRSGPFVALGSFPGVIHGLSRERVLWAMSGGEEINNVRPSNLNLNEGRLLPGASSREDHTLS